MEDQLSGPSSSEFIIIINGRLVVSAPKVGLKTVESSENLLCKSVSNGGKPDERMRDTYNIT
jgi:hypothetical protein